MKKILLLFVFFASFSGVKAQITITQSDLANVGDTLRVSNATNTIDPTPTGANYTWNYDFLTPNSQWVNSFDNPATFPSPFNLFAFISSYGLKQYTPADTIPIVNIKLENAYGYFKKSSSDLREVGYGLSVNSLPVPFMYNPQDVVYKFPLQYGDRDSCYSEFGPPAVAALPYYYGQKIHRINEVDGWGTLTTPYGTFPALRVKTTLTIRDTISYTGGINFAFPRPLQYEYKWFKQGGKIPYLQVNASDVGGNPVVSQIFYRDSVRAGVIQIGAGVNESANLNFGLQVFPNPAGEVVFMQYSLDNTQDVKIELTDIAGKTVYSRTSVKQQPGTHLDFVDLRVLDLKNGTYLLRLYAGEGSATEKIVLTR